MRGGSARPRVICHMSASIDGRIVADRWPEQVTVPMRQQYEQIHAGYGADGWICGRVTMEPFARQVRSESEVRREHTGGRPREDFRAPGHHDSYAFAIDSSGRLAWQSSDISGDHVVAILSERVSDDYLELLRERGVSYMLAGGRRVDLPLALEKIGTRFGVRTLMLEGGGKINGGFLAAGLIDEVSLLLAPAVDGRIKTPALFDMDLVASPCRLALEAVERRAGDLIWLRYRVEAAVDDRRA
jgi:2,5-diamino-6-(ribosylamino)-4(3H)-pyrimidinone 5'-phosphate reductase